MRSLLTRRVFRQLINDALLEDARPTTRVLPSSCRSCERPPAGVVPQQQRRSFWGFNRKPQRQPVVARFKTGLSLMRTAEERLRIQTRPPPARQLAAAMIAFFKSHSRNDAGAFPVEDVQLRSVKPTFEFLRDKHEDRETFCIVLVVLRMFLRVLRNGSSKLHLELATLIFEELLRRRQRSTQLEQEMEFDELHMDLTPYIWILCQNGASLKARDLVKEYWKSDLENANVSRNNGQERTPSQWSIVLKGLMKERKNSEVDETVRIMQNFDVAFDSKLHQTLTTFYAHQIGDMEMTKKWYTHPIARSGLPTNFTDATVLKLCIKNKEMDWGNPIFMRLVQKDPDDKTAWHIILQWCAANGKGVDDIEEMMRLMQKRNPDRPELHPGMDTINSMIEFCNTKDDPYNAERYYALGQKWGFAPMARTFFLQLDYRLKNKDLSGALKAYHRLQSEAPPSHAEDVPYINKLIVALCEDPDQRPEETIDLVNELRDRQGRFEATTIASLAEFHAHRDEMDDYTDLLNAFVHNYSLTDRKMICETMLKRVLNPATSHKQAWEIYMSLQNTVPEALDRDTRVQLMQAFFDRGRGDMGLHTFGHMRKDKDPALRPSLDIYCMCLEGLARHSNYSSVQLVNNMITMDDWVEPTTKLLNALMIAYTGANGANRAQKIWDDILLTREGPSYSTIRIALQACEALGPYSDDWRQSIWDMVKTKDIEVNRELFADYLGAVVGSGRTEKGWKLLENAEAECGSPVDTLM